MLIKYIKSALWRVWYSILRLGYKTVPHVTVLNIAGNCNTMVNIVILWDHRHLCGPSLTETSLCGPDWINVRDVHTKTLSMWSNFRCLRDCISYLYMKEVYRRHVKVIELMPIMFLTFRHRASCILGQAFHLTPQNAFYIFNQQFFFHDLIFFWPCIIDINI